MFYFGRHVEFTGLKNLYAKYYAEARKSTWRVLSKSYFSSLWHKVMRRGVTCPSTHVHFKTLISTVRKRGFSICDVCAMLRAKIRHATSAEEKSSYARMLQKHYDMVSADRRELARIARYVYSSHTIKCRDPLTHAPCA